MPEGPTAIVIGGGFYGAVIATYLAGQRGFSKVVLLEKELALLQRASFNNQARVHNGYHYPRSFTTAYRSRVNLPRFVTAWSAAIRQDFTKLYAIARHNSKVTAQQFSRFCQSIGASVEPATAQICALFEPRLIDTVFQVEEYAFDSTVLARWAEQELNACGVQIHYGLAARKVVRGQGSTLRVIAVDQSGEETSLDGDYVFNCTYSGLSQLAGDFPGLATGLKQEITEMALLQMPPSMEKLGVTVMDGPFFSLMPFPARGLHTLSHVRYTPHLSWLDSTSVDPYGRLQAYPRLSRVDRMRRDAARYMPGLMQAAHMDSLFEIKTVLVKNEGDDGRPILFERYSQLPGFFSVLGGKIDNIFDVLELLEREPF